MIIRQEKQEDFGEISRLVETAFETAEIVDGDEAECVDFLRKSDAYIPDLALVAEDNGRLVGHIMLTKTALHTQKQNFTVLMLSPLCVALEYRSKGVGGALIEESARLAEEMGYGAIFLCGYPSYYSRYGFRPAADFGIRHEEKEAPAARIMVRELHKNFLTEKNGTINIWYTE